MQARGLTVNLLRKMASKRFGVRTHFSAQWSLRVKALLLVAVFAVAAGLCPPHAHAGQFSRAVCPVCQFQHSAAEPFQGVERFPEWIPALAFTGRDASIWLVSDCLSRAPKLDPPPFPAA